MVIAALEEELARFTRERAVDLGDIGNPSPNPRLGNRGGELVPYTSIDAAIRDSYIQQIFEFALKSAAGTLASKHLQRLQILCESSGLYEIRNSCCHVNRPFFEFYWHRVAAIATDPVIELLGLKDVTKAFQRAQAGVIADLPEQDATDARTLPNNVPTQASHEITGLVGREAELEQILGHLANPRLPMIALVAPGGIGKTSLAIEALRHVCRLPQFAELYEAVIFISAKTERLTAKGIERLSAPATLEEVKVELAFQLARQFRSETSMNLASAMGSYADRNVLICLDNLETLIRDRQDDFLAFNIALPARWRLLLTSRVPVESALTVPVAALGLGPATRLAIHYAKRSGTAMVSEQEGSRIAQACQRNALAIRLTVDLLRDGRVLPDAIDGAMSSVVEFSYSKLVESLTDTAVHVLECILALESATRANIIEVLNRDADSIAIALAELTRTSLLIRRVDESTETFAIEPALKELILVHPRNLVARQQIARGMEKRKVLDHQVSIRQMKAGVASWSAEYIPLDAPTDLKTLCQRTNDELKSEREPSKVTELLLKQFQSGAERWADQPTFHRFRGRLLSHLGDRIGAVRCFRDAISLNAEDPTARWLLASTFLDSRDSEEAEVLFDELLEEGWGDPEKWDAEHATRLLQGYFISLLCQDKFDEILEKTAEWENKGPLRATFGSFRAAAWKRKVERYGKHDTTAISEGLTIAMKIMNEVVNLSGYSKGVATEIVKLIDLALAKLPRTTADSSPSPSTALLLEFADRHLHDVTSSGSGREPRRAELVWKLRKIGGAGNPFDSEKWTAIDDATGGQGCVNVEELLAKGYLRVCIHRVPRGDLDEPRTYMFAVDASGEQYFIHFASVENAGWAAWQALAVGSVLYVRADPASRRAGNAMPVSHTVLTSETTVVGHDRGASPRSRKAS